MSTYSSSGDSVILRSFKNKKISAEKSFVKDELVLERKYHHSKEFYQFFEKDPRVLNKKAFIIRSFWTNGKSRIVGSSLDGKNPESLYRTFYKNGMPQCICMYKNGKRDGIQLSHYDNGQLWAEVVFSKGMLWDIIKTFNQQGKSIKVGTLKNGNGTFVIYDAPDKPVRIEHYKFGILIKTEKISKSNSLAINQSQI